MPGSPGPAVRGLGRPAVPGGPGWSVDSPRHSGPQHSGSCCRPEATWPCSCGSWAGNSDQCPPPCSAPWLVGAGAPSSLTFGGVVGARARARFLARRPRALPAGAGGCLPPPSGVSFPASPPLGLSRGCAQLRPPRGTGLSSPRRCPAGPTLLCRAAMPGRLCPATCWAPGARGAGTMATFREPTWAEVGPATLGRTPGTPPPVLRVTTGGVQPAQPGHSGTCGAPMEPAPWLGPGFFGKNCGLC